MALPSCSEEEFISLVQTFGTQGTANRLGITDRKVRERSARLRESGKQVAPPNQPYQSFPTRLTLDVPNGVVLVASDCHYWPGHVTTAHRAFVRACKELNPVAVVMNGDVFDGASISRHPPIGWSRNPTVKEEIETCQDRLAEIIEAAPKAARVWTMGNHDIRFMSRLSMHAPQYEGVEGFDIQDHFPEWQHCVAVWINDKVVCKHRYRGGIHASHNNTLNSGMSIVTGHLHSLKVSHFTDYRGTRYGVDTGCMVAQNGPQVAYAEDDPRNHRSGFAVLSFVDGELMQPELVMVLDEDAGTVTFRGKKYSV